MHIFFLLNKSVSSPTIEVQLGVYNTQIFIIWYLVIPSPKIS